MKHYSVGFYVNARGEEPVRAFMDSQDAATRSKFVKLVDLLQVYGPELMMPYARYLRKGMYELRIRGKNEVRIFYICILREQEIVLLHAFKKRTQKLPSKELAIALSRQEELTQL